MPPRSKAVTISAAAAAATATNSMPTTPTTPTSRKRKADDKNLQKFYAVRVGMRPGIYLTWQECQSQIAGFKGAQFKSFTSREDAAAFVAGKNPEGGAKDKGEPKFYAVAVGNYPGIYTDWETASRAIVGAKGPKYKKFPTRAEAANFIRMYGNAATRQALSAAVSSGAAGAVQDQEDDEEDEEDDDDDEEDDDDDDDETAVTLPPSKAAKKGAAPVGVLNVYTDGSSLGNGKSGASAGIGVFFGQGDKRNISERLMGEPQTNQRAELTAIMRALQAVPVSQPLRIFSDSNYAINCVTDWYKSWATNGWRTRGGDPVMNQDLIKGVRAFIDTRDKAGTVTMFRWVKGHNGDSGNVAADMLATQGARLRT